MLGVQPQTSEEIDWSKWGAVAHNPGLPRASFGPSADAVYLSPFEVGDIHYITSFSGVRFKFDYTGTGFFWGFTFRLGLYRMMRGTGGTSATYKLLYQFGTITRSAALGSPATGTLYTCDTASTVGSFQLESGTYAFGFQWDNESGPMSTITWNSYGMTFPGNAGWWHYGDGSSAGSLPTSIATVGAPTPFHIYWEHA